jgi:hypothetical protein
MEENDRRQTLCEVLIIKKPDMPHVTVFEGGYDRLKVILPGSFVSSKFRLNCAAACLDTATN